MLRIIDIREYAEDAAGLICRSFAPVAAEFKLTRENCPSHPSFTTAESLIERLAREDCCCFGLFQEGALIGFASLMPAWGGHGDYELTRLAVAPELRHKGYGKLLLDAAERKSKELGADKITLGMIDAHKILKDWYKTHGFAVTSTKEFPQLPFIVCYMEKMLY